MKRLFIVLGLTAALVLSSCKENASSKVNTENLQEITDFNGYREEFLGLFGFGFDSVDYDADVSPVVNADF